MKLVKLICEVGKVALLVYSFIHFLSPASQSTGNVPLPPCCSFGKSGLQPCLLLSVLDAFANNRWLISVIMSSTWPSAASVRCRYKSETDPASSYQWQWWLTGDSSAKMSGLPAMVSGESVLKLNCQGVFL